SAGGGEPGRTANRSRSPVGKSAARGRAWGSGPHFSTGGDGQRLWTWPPPGPHCAATVLAAAVVAEGSPAPSSAQLRGLRLRCPGTPLAGRDRPKGIFLPAATPAQGSEKLT
ncbi:unnamed protein product, partial [Rangifer tarandus platyrhynchus]